MKSKIEVENAQQVSFAGLGRIVIMQNIQEWKKKLNGYVITKGNKISFSYKGEIIDFIVINHTPEPGAVKIHQGTHIFIQEEDHDTRLARLRKLYNEGDS